MTAGFDFSSRVREQWGFALTDPKGNAVAELVNASNRTVSLRLNRVPTGSFVLPTNSPLINTVRQGDQILIKAYRNNVLVAQGPLVPGYNKQVQGGSAGGGAVRSIQVTWSGVGWRLGRRIVPGSKSATGITYPAAANTFQDRGTTAVAIINALNTEAPPAGVPATAMDTGVRIGSVTPSSSTQAGPWVYKNALEAISDLSATLDGFDWEIAPTEPVKDSIGLQLGLFNASAAIGQTRSNDVMFEYGDGKNNVVAFTEITDFSGAMNRGYSIPTSFGSDNTVQVLSSFDAQAIINGGTLYEDSIPSDVTTDDMRTKLLIDNIAVRKTPKTLITFQPSVSRQAGLVPQFGTDWIVGDIVHFRAVEYGMETINGLFRIYGVDFTIGDNGEETAVPILVETDS